MLKIIREGLTIRYEGALLECKGSANVPILIENDDTYNDYEVLVNVGYNDGEEYCVKNDDKYLLSSNVFKRSGAIHVSIHLKKDDVIRVTNQLTFKVEQSPNGGVVI